jgi:hypothetical protein
MSKFAAGTEHSSLDIAVIAAEAMREQGCDTSPTNGSHGSRFAFVIITLPNGQQFKLQVEEL